MIRSLMRKATRPVGLFAVVGVAGAALGLGVTVAASKPSTDKAAPAITLAFPTANGAYNATAWDAGCSPTGICGTATDQTGVTSVQVAVTQSGTLAFSPAVLGSPGATSTTWSLPYPLPAEGSYMVAVRATDQLGNTTAAKSQTTAGFRIDTQAPPAPVLTDKPLNPTSENKARFRVANPEAGVALECRLDGAPFGACDDVVTFSDLSIGEHCFAVRAVDGAGNRGAELNYCWWIVLKDRFQISGAVDLPFFPGVTRPLNLLIGNPYNFDIRVTGVQITVKADTGANGCDGPTNVQVTQGFTVPVTVPGNTTRSLLQLGVPPEDLPELTMPNLPTNQDACKGATFSFAYSGEAVRP